MPPPHLISFCSNPLPFCKVKPISFADDVSPPINVTTDALSLLDGEPPSMIVCET